MKPAALASRQLLRITTTDVNEWVSFARTTPTEGKVEFALVCRIAGGVEVWRMTMGREGDLAAALLGPLASLGRRGPSTFAHLVVPLLQAAVLFGRLTSVLGVDLASTRMNVLCTQTIIASFLAPLLAGASTGLGPTRDTPQRRVSAWLD